MKLFLPNGVKHISIALLLIASFSGKSQSLFFHNNCNVHPLFGDSLTGIETDYDTTAVQPGASGAGVNWNFSSLTTTTSQAYSTEVYIDPASTVQGSSFPSSNLAQRGSAITSAVNYYNYSTDSITELGSSYTPVAGCNYTVLDPFRYTICPFNYGNTYVDHNNYNSCSSSTYDHNYTTATFVFDGTGALTLPAASYSNVIRYKYVASVIDSTFLIATNQFTNVINGTVTVYMWLDASNVLTPLVFLQQDISYPSFSFHGRQVASINYTHFPATTTVGIKGIKMNEKFVIYPVPASDALNIKASEIFSGGAFKIYDCFGRTIKEGATAESIEIRGIEKGIYFLELSTKDGIVERQKFTKE